MIYTDEQFQSGDGIPARNFKFKASIQEGVDVSGPEAASYVVMTGEKALWGFYKDYGSPPRHVQLFDFTADGERVIGALAFDEGET